MGDSWRALVGRDLDIEPDPKRPAVVVRFDNGRSHRVRVRVAPDGYVLESVIAGPAHTALLGDLHIAAWKRNRSSRLVGYRIDAYGRLVAHVWTPREGLTPEMFMLLMRQVAGEADRHELLLTGRDRR